MSIANKILWSISILVLGYSLTIVYGFFMGIQNNTQLNVLSSKIVPASQISQKALNLFEEQIKIYQDMIAAGDKQLGPKAKNKGEDVQNTLEALKRITPNSPTKNDIDRTLVLLKSFNLEAPEVYEEMRGSALGYTPAIMDKANILSKKHKAILQSLTQYRDHFSDTLQKEMLGLGQMLKHMAFMNVVIFIVGVMTSIVIIIFIISRFIRAPLQKTIAAFSTGAMGDFSVRLDESEGDEFSQLAFYFNRFMEKLDVYNRDLRDEIKGHQQAVDRLRKSEELYTKLVNTIPEVVVRTDIEGRILFANDFTMELLGYSRDEIIGQSVLMFVAEDEHARAVTNMANMLFQRQPLHEYQVIRKDGEPLYFEIGGDILRHEDGQPFGRVYVCRDITLRRHSENEREKLQDQLIQAQKMESVGRLAGGVAHDFNNMLSIIIGNAEMALQDVPATDPLHARMKEILSAGMRSADLTRQLLAFARKQTINPRILDLNDVVTSMLKMLQRLIGEDIQLVWMPGRDLWSVSADPSQIDQILANLVVNARDAIADQGKITIETSNAVYDDSYCSTHLDCSPGEYLLLAVSDNGTGMDKDTLTHIFEPFFTTKENDRGTGLGLATVYGIARQNKGFINVYSEPGQGTTFKIYLPRCADVETGLIKPDTSDIPTGTETVMVVEDETAVLHLGRHMLERLGYTVWPFSHVSDALAHARDFDGPIHLLLTDVVMPEMNGKELVKRIRESKPEIKCLYMSGYTANVIAHHGILDKGVNFIAKPFNLRDLAVKLREVITS